MLRPLMLRSYRAARFPVSLLCVNRHRSLRLLCRLRRRGRRNGGRRRVYMWAECERRRVPTPFHTSTESPHHPVDEGPKVQCGATDERNWWERRRSWIRFSRSARRPRQPQKRPSLPTVPEVSGPCRTLEVAASEGFLSSCLSNI